MGDVIEYLIDGTSGLAPGGVDGKALVVGVCSKGRVGKAYLIGKRTDLDAVLGVGPLVDRVRDMLATAGQEPVLVAVPAQGQARGYCSVPSVHGGSGKAPEMRVSGVPQGNADVVIKVVTGGALGTATVSISTDGGTAFGETTTSAASLPLSKEDQALGVTVQFKEGAKLEEGSSYRFVVRTAIGSVQRIGDAESPLLEVTGTPLASCELVVQIVRNGTRNEGTYQLSTDGGESFGKIRTIPVDGSVALDAGVKLAFPEGTYSGGTTYTCRILPPQPSIVDIMSALDAPLALYDVEFVHVVGASDSVDWAAASAKADELWNLHRPTYFKMEARLPHDDEDMNDYAAYLLAERQNAAFRFVQVCAQFGEVVESSGQSRLRNWAGLQSGRVMSIPVQRATGRVRDGGIIQGRLPEGWEAVQSTLEDAGYLTAKKYAGLHGVYWGDSRTLADDTSDFRYEEVVRVTFKAVRLLRIAALKSMYDEAGDPLLGTHASGIAYLKAQLENALSTMTKAIPPELTSYVVSIPPHQDIVNNGIAIEHVLIGVPIIRKIKLYASYTYAGSTLDPRTK